MLGQRLVTHQTGPEGLPINTVYVESRLRHRARAVSEPAGRPGPEQVAIMASAAGGMDIEEVAAKTPEKIFTRGRASRRPV